MDEPLSPFAIPVVSSARRQPRLQRLLDQLAKLEPTWAIRIDVEDREFVLQVFVYDRPVRDVTERHLHLLEIRRVEFPHYEDGRVYQLPEDLLRHWIARAGTVETDPIRDRSE